MRRHMALSCLGLLALAGSLACSSGHGPLTITIDRSTTLVSSPVHVVVDGLNSSAPATLTVSTTDAGGHLWSSSASFTADANGQIDLSQARPNSGGSYTEVDGMGLFRSMKPAGPSPLPAFLTPPGPNEVDKIVVSSGSQQVAHQLVRQFYGPGVMLTRKRTPTAAFYGDYFSPAGLSTSKPGVLIFGGSEGGLSGATEAAQLASHGYPALAVAYFAEPGLPATLLDVPLEYFVGALTWLSQQPGVDPAHLVVYGVSRGSEAALLLGADFPNLVHAVVALVPSAWVNCSLPSCTGSAWTVNGRPIPFDGPAGGAEALIPVAKIQGPIFIDCGDDDAVWTSCQYSNRIKAELATGFPYQHPILEFPDAGHGIGSIVPYLSSSEPVAFQGRIPSSNQLARELAWPQLLNFMAGVARG